MAYFSTPLPWVWLWNLLWHMEYGRNVSALVQCMGIKTSVFLLLSRIFVIVIRSTCLGVPTGSRKRMRPLGELVLPSGVQPRLALPQLAW